MRRLLGLAAVLVLATGLWAAAADPPKSPANELAALKKSVAEAQKKAFDLLSKANRTEDKDEKKKLNDEFEKEYAEFQKFQRESHAKAVTIAKADPKSEVGLDAALWALPGMRAKPEQMKELLALVLEHHMTNKKISGTIGLLSMQAGRMPPPTMAPADAAKVVEDAAKALETLETIAEKSPHKSVQAAAVFAIAESYKNKAEPYGRPAPPDAEDLAKKAEAGFERVEKEYA